MPGIWFSCLGPSQRNEKLLFEKASEQIVQFFKTETFPEDFKSYISNFNYVITPSTNTLTFKFTNKNGIWDVDAEEIPNKNITITFKRNGKSWTRTIDLPVKN